MKLLAHLFRNIQCNRKLLSRRSFNKRMFCWQVVNLLALWSFCNIRNEQKISQQWTRSQQSIWEIFLNFFGTEVVTFQINNIKLAHNRGNLRQWMLAVEKFQFWRNAFFFSFFFCRFFCAFQWGKMWKFSQLNLAEVFFFSFRTFSRSVFAQRRNWDADLTTSQFISGGSSSCDWFSRMVLVSLERELVEGSSELVFIKKKEKKNFDNDTDELRPVRNYLDRTKRSLNKQIRDNSNRHPHQSLTRPTSFSFFRKRSTWMPLDIQMKIMKFADRISEWRCSVQTTWKRPLARSFFASTQIGVEATR